MFGLGVRELVLILVIGLVIFGPGKSLKEFKEAVHEPAAAKEDIKETVSEAVSPASTENHGK